MRDQTRIAKPIEEFIRVVENQHQAKIKQQAGSTETQEESAQIAFWYEKIRIAIDYREEHLLRRTACRRILKRLFILERRRQEVADMVLRELILGGYVKKSDLSEEKFIKIDQALNKYAYVIGGSYNEKVSLGYGKKIRRFFISIASFEIEEILYPNLERRAIIEAIFKLLAPRINTVSFNVTEKQKNLQTYVAIYRSLARADRAMVISEIFKIYFPGWFDNPNKQEIDQIIQNAKPIIKSVRHQATNALASKIFYAIKKQTLYSHILYEIAMDNPGDIRGIVKQEFLLQRFVQDKMQQEYDRVREKLGRRIRRGIVYIFISKMLFALLLEIPYEKYFEGGLNYSALGINLLFPPIFLSIIASSAKIPKQANTEAIYHGITRLCYDEPGQDEIGRINVAMISRAKTSEKILNFIYLVVFLMVFSGVVSILYYFDFGIMSSVIFIIFLATVSFFGAMIRQTVRDLVVVKEKEGLVSLFFDTMLLPFVRFGRWLSTNFSRVNIFVFLLDVIIEAPFKMIIRLFESWVEFLKRKREEVDQQFEWE
ncbi:MAG: hypothetical protein GF332_01880 [Candidatus Moranbacteria bacterium]|nr:hypothetical protein [Candidatus Moranbacteria bacterium]